MTRRVWMTNGKVRRRVRHDEIHMFINKGFAEGRKLQPTSTLSSKLQNGITWECNPGTALVDPAYYPFQDGKFVKRIHIQDCSAYQGGFSVIQEITVDCRNVLEVHPACNTLDDAKTYAERLIRQSMKNG